MENLNTLSITTLAAIYNAAIEDNKLEVSPVKKFADKASGVKRITKLAEDHNLILLDNGAGGLGLFSAEKTKDEDTVEYKFNEGTNSEDQPAAPKAKKEKKAKEPKAKKEKKAKEPKEPKRRGPAPDYADELKIEVIVDANPKKVNTPSFDRFALYYTNQTVGEFIKAGGTRADLRWDVAHDFIKIG